MARDYKGVSNQGINGVVLPVLTPDRAEKRQNGRRFKENGEPAFTLTAEDRHGVAVGIDDLYANREPRFYDEQSPTLRSDRQGLKVGVEVIGNYSPSEHNASRIVEPDGIAPTVMENHGTVTAVPEVLGCLRQVRSEYGKEIRKDYENGLINVSRHDFTESEVKEDGCTNTISTVEKDNRIVVKVKEATKQGYAECRVGGGQLQSGFP